MQAAETEKRTIWEDKWSRLDFAPWWQTPDLPQSFTDAISSLGLEGSRRWLDLGCGSGVQTLLIAEKLGSCLGVDFSASAIEIAREQAERTGSTATFAMADVTCEDFPDGPFEAAFDRGCMHTLPSASLPDYARNVSRQLVAGGYLIVLHKQSDPRQDVLEHVAGGLGGFFDAEFATEITFTGNGKKMAGRLMVLRNKRKTGGGA